MTDRQLTDLMRAADMLDHIGRKIFETMEPLWDDDENSFNRAIATLHAIIREYKP